MKTEEPVSSIVSSESTNTTSVEDNSARPNAMKRRSFLKGVGVAGMALSAGSLLAIDAKASTPSSGALNKGDVAILRLLAAAELIEADLWQQYAELAESRN